MVGEGMRLIYFVRQELNAKPTNPMSKNPKDDNVDNLGNAHKDRQFTLNDIDQDRLTSAQPAKSDCQNLQILAAADFGSQSPAWIVQHTVLWQRCTT
jgi:hypothetical protein